MTIAPIKTGSRRTLVWFAAAISAAVVLEMWDLYAPALNAITDNLGSAEQAEDSASNAGYQGLHMAALLLLDKEQAAVRAIIASEPIPGATLPGTGVVRHVARLIGCDAVGVALLDNTGYAADGFSLPRGWTTGVDQLAWDGPVGLGIQQLSRSPDLAHSTTAPGIETLALGVRNGPHHIVLLWMDRRQGHFSGRDRALLDLVTPALERLLRERRTPALPSLTAQERRVLRHVAAGFSNAEIGERMFIAPCTVRKHLENAYRKLGVTNRLAAVLALQGGRLPDPGTGADPGHDPDPGTAPDPVERLERFA